MKRNGKREKRRYFSASEKALLIGSYAVICAAFFFFKSKNYATLAASIIGATSLIFNAKANPIGQALMVVFSFIYGAVSLGCRYYGEAITYLGMTAPMAVAALVSWIRNPSEGKKNEVKINRISPKEAVFAVCLSLIVAVVFYFPLKWFDTANLLLSATSVFMSFLAAYLTFRRSPSFALAYAANDAVLIALWILATVQGGDYASVVACFAIFLANDLYGYLNWKSIAAFQRSEKK